MSSNEEHEREAWRDEVARIVELLVREFRHDLTEHEGLSVDNAIDAISAAGLRLLRAPAEPAAREMDPRALEEAALALMQLRGGPGVPLRDEARVAVEAYLRAAPTSPAAPPEPQRWCGVCADERKKLGLSNKVHCICAPPEPQQDADRLVDRLVGHAATVIDWGGGHRTRTQAMSWVSAARGLLDDAAAALRAARDTEQRLRGTLLAYMSAFGGVDNGYCRECGGHRKYDPHGNPGVCENASCLSHAARRALATTDTEGSDAG